MKKYPEPRRYVPKFPAKYVGNINQIIIRSSFERKFVKWCDNNPSVLKWGSEIYPIQYWSNVDEKFRRYFIDFFVQLVKDDNTLQNLAIEIKPRSQINKPVKGRKKAKTYMTECLTWQTNQDKWKAATEWCNKNGFIFIVMDEYDLGIKMRI